MERHGRQHVLGLHFLGPNAGEVMQGFGAAIRYKLIQQNPVKILPTTTKSMIMFI